MGKTKFVSTIYRIAAVYGFLSLPPLYFLADRVGHDVPPPLTHLEFYYGFIGLALLWQFVFLLIASDPGRYRALMPLTILEKCVFSVPVFVLYYLGRLAAPMVLPALMDATLGMLFIAAYLRSASTI